MALLLELSPLAQIRLRNHYGETKSERNLQPVQSKTLQRELQIATSFARLEGRFVISRDRSALIGACLFDFLDCLFDFGFWLGP